MPPLARRGYPTGLSGKNASRPDAIPQTQSSAAVQRWATRVLRSAMTAQADSRPRSAKLTSISQANRPRP